MFIVYQGILATKFFPKFECVMNNSKKVYVCDGDAGLELRVHNETFIFLFLNQNICCGYSKELSQ